MSAVLQADNDRYTDRLKRRLDDRDAADSALEQRIAAEVDRMTGRASDDPAYCARIVTDAEISLHELQVKLHGEQMSWERAVFDLLHMAARRDDPEALAVAAEALRAEVAGAIQTDAAIYGMAATTVALGEDYE